jgi:tetratricopeptide (TPR) repeat protein
MMALLLVSVPGCKKDKTTAPVDATPSGEAEPEEPDVPQEPDPPDIADGRRAYLLGEYAQVTESLAPVYVDLKERSQYRASGLAGGWLALAHARDVVENAEEPARHAVDMAAKTNDREVQAVAKMAYGAYLMGTEDFEAAVASFDAAAAFGTADAAMAHILHAEAMIGRAFGGSDSSTVQNPKDLDAAAADYEKAAKLAAKTDLADALSGRTEEGLAAVAKYRGDSKKICEHAKKASEHYEAAGASAFLKEGPEALMRNARCK